MQQGKTPVTSENVIMNVWYNGYADPKEMIKEGYELISTPDGWLYIVPAAGYYHDYLNLGVVYDKWEPIQIGNQLFPAGHPQILGGTFAVWNDPLRKRHFRKRCASPDFSRDAGVGTENVGRTYRSSV